MSESARSDHQPWQNPSFDDGDAGPRAEQAETPLTASRPGDFVPVVTRDGRINEALEPGFDEGFAAGGPATGADGEPDFAAMKFLRENTLLSNAEKYAASIREEAELYVERLRKEAEALNVEAESRYEEARQAKEQADREAEALIASAQEETERIREEARQEGFDAGWEEGIRRRYEEAAPHLERLQSILEELGNYRRQVSYYAERDSVRLAVLMAKHVLRQELKINRKAVWNLLAKTLATMEGQGQFRIWINPEDYEFAKSARASLERFVDEDQSITLRARPDVPAGNVQIETDREVIDLTFQNQFHYLEAVMNQALGERETVVTQRPASALPAIPEKGPPVPAPATDESVNGLPAESESE